MLSRIQKAVSAFLNNPNGFLAIIMGWGIARLLFPPITGEVLGPFVSLPGFAVAIFCLFMLLLASQPSIRLLLLFASGMIADSFVFWSIRSGMGASIELTSLWTMPAIIGSISTLLIVLLLYFIFSILPLDMLSYGYQKIKINTMLVTLLPILTIAVIRVSFLLMKDIPNESRSLFIKGTEIHHAVTGTFILMLLNIAAIHMQKRRGILFNILLGIIAGLILDQLLYLTLREVTDDAYNNIYSWTGAIFGSILFALAGIVFRDAKAPARQTPGD